MSKYLFISVSWYLIILKRFLELEGRFALLYSNCSKKLSQKIVFMLAHQMVIQVFFAKFKVYVIVICVPNKQLYKSIQLRVGRFPHKFQLAGNDKLPFFAVIKFISRSCITFFLKPEILVNISVEWHNLLEMDA